MRRTAGHLLRGCCLALAVAALAGCSQKEEAAAVSAVDDGVLTVGIIDGEDVFASRGQSGFEGIEPSILNTLAANLGVQIAYVEAEDTQQLMDQMDAGTIDVAAGRLGQLEIYSSGHLVSDSYARKGIYLVTPANLYVDSLITFTDENVGISSLTPDTARLELPNVENVTLVNYTDLSGVPEDINGDVIAALICTEREALALAKKGLRAIELHGGPQTETVFYLAPGQTELQENLNAAIGQYLDGQ